MANTQLNHLELENKEMKSNICAFNSELEESKNMLVYNQPLVSLDDQLSRLNSINKRPPLLATDRFYAMAQAVMPKSSSEAISVRGVFIVSGFLASLGINDNKLYLGYLIPFLFHQTFGMW